MQPRHHRQDCKTGSLRGIIIALKPVADMPYRVTIGSLTVLAGTAREAIELFERFAEGDNNKDVSIRSPDGKRIDPAVLRKLVSDSK